MTYRCSKWRSGDVPKATGPVRSGLTWRLTWHRLLCGCDIREVGREPPRTVVGSHRDGPP